MTLETLEKAKKICDSITFFKVRREAFQRILNHPTYFTLYFQEDNKEELIWFDTEYITQSDIEHRVAQDYIKYLDQQIQALTDELAKL